MPVRSRSAEEAHRGAIATSIADICSFLVEVLGRTLVAYMLDVDPKTVGRWARGETAPKHAHEMKLRDTHQIFRLLLAKESSHTVRAWFIGRNPQLEDVAPAEAILQDRTKDVIVAARAYAAGG